MAVDDGGDDDILFVLTSLLTVGYVTDRFDRTA